MLVDTTVISYIYKGDTRAKSYEQHLKGQTLFVSFMTNWRLTIKERPNRIKLIRELY